jgi:tRNA-splicing ligase RtcB
MKARETRPGVWEFKEEGMRVPGRVYATEKLFSSIEDGVFRQVGNVAKLPGILRASMAMPDAHYGYGFPIGGVAAFSLEEGVISPGGVGYDINCGVRLLVTNLSEKEVRPKLRGLVDKLFDNIPSGLGSKSKLRATDSELARACTEGSKWAVAEGYGLPEDLTHTEEGGAIAGADPGKISSRAKERGRPQFGTLGSGNHFLEIQRVDRILEPSVARRFGLTSEGQVTVMVHCGSRGLGYQIADEYINTMLGAARKYGIKLPDNELACAPLNSREAQDYVGAMYCAVNYAFANRQVITHWVRETFREVFGDEAELSLLYDVCHNIAKFEEHEGVGRVCVHRKGATRAFAAGRAEVPKDLRDIGQPVIVPGSMGTASYVLVGTEAAMKETWGSVCHGAGRTLSRAAAIRQVRGEQVKQELEKRGEFIRSDSWKTLAEEAPFAYKDVDEVIRSVELAGLSKAVVRLTPLGVAKG